MIKNISVRFLIVFIAFFTAGIFLVLTLSKTISLNEHIEAFHHKVAIPLAKFSAIVRDTHIATLQAIEPSLSGDSSVSTKAVELVENGNVQDLFDQILDFDNHYMKEKSLEQNVHALRKEWGRYIKARNSYVRSARSKIRELLDIRKETSDYMLRYTTLLSSIENLEKNYTRTYQGIIEEEKKVLKDTFYVAIIVAASTLILLTFLLFEVNSINQKLKSFLEEKEDFQEKLAEANKELARYSEQLENEVKKRTDEAIEHLMKNPLTKLPNRISFMEKLKNVPKASVAIFNIDRFQSYNDLFGSKVGDKIIQDYAAYLRQTIPYLYEIYHLQGDEFAVVEMEQKSANTFLAMIRQAAKLAHEFHFSDSNGDFILQISIGVAIDQDQPLIRADMALKHAKNSNESLVIYSDQLIKPHRYLENVTMTKELTSAIREERIIPYFQAIADTKTKEIHKYEVLARLIDSSGKIVSPAHFISLAKQIRLYPDITKIIFKKAMDAVEEHGFHLSINLSADDIHHIPTRDYIIDRLALSKQSNHITFELLESEEAQNYEDIHMFIERVKHYGVEIAIDDFGSGYSNFAKILKLKVDYLKIDGSFIKKIDKDPDSKEFVEIIHHLAANYNLKTVAEFVSTESVYETVKSIGVDYAQGYHISKPKPLESLFGTDHPSQSEETQTTLNSEPTEIIG